MPLVLLYFQVDSMARAKKRAREVHGSNSSLSKTAAFNGVAVVSGIRSKVGAVSQAFDREDHWLRAGEEVRIHISTRIGSNHFGCARVARLHSTGLAHS